jgi:hypothetical protein
MGELNVYVALDESTFSIRSVSQAHVVIGRRKAADYRRNGWNVLRVENGWRDPFLVNTLREALKVMEDAD